MADQNASPISAAKPPVSNPMSSATSVHASTLKLKPVIRKPTLGGTATHLPPRPTAAAKPAAPAPAAPAAAPAPNAMEQLKGVTQKLKGITQEIPAEAILHKTGIIADQGMTEAQKQASKARTARISLSDAIGVAPVQNEAAPMKTIRIKRPVDLQAAKPAPAPAPAAEPAPAPEAAPQAAAPAPTVTQRKTLKIARPGAGATRPSGKFGVKKPGATALPKPAEPAEGGEVADIPELEDAGAAQAPKAMYTAAPVPGDRIPDVGKGLQVVDLILQIVACIAIGFLGWKLYLDTTMIFAF